jgi:hypothetical protein
VGFEILGYGKGHMGNWKLNELKNYGKVEKHPEPTKTVETQRRSSS